MSISATQWLSRLRVDIISNSNRVYANGRQQVAVAVSLTPRDGQTISAEQLDSVTLFEIDDDGQYRSLEHELVAHPTRDPRFDYFNASGSAPHPVLDASRQTRRRTFYLSSTRPGGSLSTVYAGVYIDAQTLFVTDTAPFKSSVVVESVAPPTAHRSMFALEMQPKETYKEASESYWDDEVEEQVGLFGFAAPGQRIVDSVAHGTAAEIPFYERHGWDNTLISFELTNDYSSTTTITVYQPDRYVDQHGSSPSPHHMALHLYHRRFYRRHRNDLRSDVSAWTLIDQHGNGYRVDFLALADGRSVDFRIIDSER